MIFTGREAEPDQIRVASKWGFSPSSPNSSDTSAGSCSPSSSPSPYTIRFLLRSSSKTTLFITVFNFSMLHEGPPPLFFFTMSLKLSICDCTVSCTVVSTAACSDLSCSSLRSISSPCSRMTLSLSAILSFIYSIASSWRRGERTGYGQVFYNLIHSKLPSALTKPPGNRGDA